MAIVTQELLNLINKLETEQQSVDNQINDIQSNAIPEARNKLDITVKEVESARDTVSSRLGIKIPSFDIPLVNENIATSSAKFVDDAFKIFNEGDKALKEPSKLKLNLPPKVSDFATQLAGGLSIKNFLSSLSGVSLPGMEELDSLKTLAAGAQAALDGNLSSISKTLGDVGALDAVKSFGDLKKYKDLATESYKKANSFIEEAKSLKEKGGKAIQEAENAYNQTKQTVESTVNGLKEQAKGLEVEAAKLYEQAKSLPDNLKEETLSKANALLEDAKSKYDDAKKTGENLVKDAQTKFESETAKAKSFLDKAREVENRPEVTQAKEYAVAVSEKEKEVNSIKAKVPSDVVATIESAVDATNKLESASAKASFIQESALKSRVVGDAPKNVASHVPLEFQSFSEWVLNRENEVYAEPNYQPPNIDLSPTVVDPNVNVSLVPSTVVTYKPPEPVLDTSYVIYRGASGAMKNPVKNEIEIGNYKHYGVERFPTRFKSFCDFGVNKDSVVDLNKLFSGYVDKIMSPIDIAIILNAGNVGMFNNIVPYGFGVGSELAAPITFQNTKLGRSYGTLFNQGGVGTKRGANWAFQPHWAGLYINFLLETNGIYQSDDDFIDLTHIKHLDTLIGKGSAYGLRLPNTAPLTEIPRSFPGAVIGYYNKATRQGHAEILLRVSLNGFLTLGGNTKIDDASKVGSSHGFKFYHSLKEFSPDHEVLIIRRGVKNGWTVNGRLDGRLKKTPVIDEYLRAIEDTSHPKNKKLLIGAYNLLRTHVSGIVYTRGDSMQNPTDIVVLDGTDKLGLLDDSFKLHGQYDSYINNRPPSPYNVIDGKELEKSADRIGH
jgi:hypothetical protein